mmetsp:Transcript_20768/g.65487  ORF Transcript_20768/g.65487 Transcript_20768/m.65487 type:complete len:244 (-) Transcript_20768:57-788(-)
MVVHVVAPRVEELEDHVLLVAEHRVRADRVHKRDHRCIVAVEVAQQEEAEGAGEGGGREEAQAHVDLVDVVGVLQLRQPRVRAVEDELGGEGRRLDARAHGEVGGQEHEELAVVRVLEQERVGHALEEVHGGLEAPAVGHKNVRMVEGIEAQLPVRPAPRLEAELEAWALHESQRRTVRRTRTRGLAVVGRSLGYARPREHVGELLDARHDRREGREVGAGGRVEEVQEDELRVRVVRHPCGR